MTDHQQIDRQRLVVLDLPGFANLSKARLQMRLPDLRWPGVGQQKSGVIRSSKMKNRTISLAGPADIETQDHGVVPIFFETPAKHRAFRFPESFALVRGRSRFRKGSV